MHATPGHYPERHMRERAYTYFDGDNEQTEIRLRPFALNDSLLSLEPVAIHSQHALQMTQLARRLLKVPLSNGGRTPDRTKREQHCKCFDRILLLPKYVVMPV